MEATGMIDALQNAAISSLPKDKPPKELEAQRPHFYGDAAALSAGIQRIVTDRDQYRQRAESLEREIVRLRALNDEIRKQNGQVSAVRDHYMRFASELLAHLKQVDIAIHEIVAKALKSDELTSLAQRLASTRAGGSDTVEKS
jgi:hypothetical protein